MSFQTSSDQPGGSRSCWLRRHQPGCGEQVGGRDAVPAGPARRGRACLQRITQGLGPARARRHVGSFLPGTAFWKGWALIPSGWSYFSAADPPDKGDRAPSLLATGRLIARKPARTAPSVVATGWLRVATGLLSINFLRRSPLGGGRAALWGCL